MNGYQDFRVLPEPEVNGGVLMATLFGRIHLALVAAGEGKVGVSFPELAKTPGCLLRLHGEHSNLQRVFQHLNLHGLRDYLHVGEISDVPDGAQYRTVMRVQVKSSVTRLLRRSVRKGWITEEEAAVRLSTAVDKSCSLPFIPVKSQSNGQTFRLFIEQGKLQADPAPGRFNYYGFSTAATVPWF